MTAGQGKGAATEANFAAPPFNAGLNLQQEM